LVYPISMQAGYNHKGNIPVFMVLINQSIQWFFLLFLPNYF